jgi:hypothetical protein
MSFLTETLRQKVRQRAGSRCEYCLSHQDYIMGRLQIDHIQPLTKGGANTEDNLCLAWELCNQYKWTQTEAIDPESELLVSLFNPRLQRWQEHFTWSSELQEDDFFRPETINLVWRHFPDSVLKPLQGSSLFFTGLSKANNNPVLYYHLNNRQDLTNYFKINDTAQRVHSFYQHQDILPNMWVGTTQKELEKTRIENIRLYYYKSFKME